MHIEWNGHNGEASAHRFLPYQPLGREAGDFVPGDPVHGTLFDVWPGPYQQ
jgi:hypothetical protein